MTETTTGQIVSKGHPQRFTTTVRSLHQFSPSGYQLTLERHHLQFEPGHLVTIHGEHVFEDRSYNISSGIHDENLDVLFREIPEGLMTQRLVQLRAGDEIDISGPYGEFVLRDPLRPCIFVGTGTGISPCRSFVRSHPELNALIAHGVRGPEDLFYRDEFSAYEYHPCLSLQERSGFHGRVTDWFRDFIPPSSADYYLCGSQEMIYDMLDWFKEKNIEQRHIITEPYYYKPTYE